MSKRKVGARRKGGQSGNTNALKHGFYSRHFSVMEVADAGADGSLEDEIRLLRVVARRALEQMGTTRGAAMRARLAEVIGLTAQRIGGLYRVRQLVQGGGAGLDAVLAEALREVAEEKLGPT